MIWQNICKLFFIALIVHKLVKKFLIQISIGCKFYDRFLCKVDCEVLKEKIECDIKCVFDSFSIKITFQIK